MTVAPACHGYRLVKRRWASTAFDGEGARRFGGRWNSPGRPCVYLASSESLAILEVLVHLEDTRVLREFALFRVDLQASDLLRLEPAELPADWQEYPAPPSTAQVGDAWLDACVSAALVVPSTIVPREPNYLLNPEHARSAAIVRTAVELDFQVDPRLAG